MRRNDRNNPIAESRRWNPPLVEAGGGHLASVIDCISNKITEKQGPIKESLFSRRIMEL